MIVCSLKDNPALTDAGKIELKRAALDGVLWPAGQRVRLLFDAGLGSASDGAPTDGGERNRSDAKSKRRRALLE